MQKWLRLEEKLAAQPTDEVSHWASGALYGETFCGMKRGKPTHYAAGKYSVESDVTPSRHLIRRLTLGNAVGIFKDNLVPFGANAEGIRPKRPSALPHLPLKGKAF